MYAILNTKTNKFVYGTDYRYFPSRQRTSTEQALLFKYMFEAKTEFKTRQCGKDYKIVKVNLNIEKILNNKDIEKIIKEE